MCIGGTSIDCDRICRVPPVLRDEIHCISHSGQAVITWEQIPREGLHEKECGTIAA
jgi:hypothetical protein